MPFLPELNVDKNVLRNLRAHLEAIRDAAGPDIDLLLHLNFNAKTEGCLKILKEIADFDMFCSRSTATTRRRSASMSTSVTVRPIVLKQRPTGKSSK